MNLDSYGWSNPEDDDDFDAEPDDSDYYDPHAT